VVALRVHVTPKSSRDEVIGWRAGEVAIRISTPPAGGKANKAVVRLISKALGVPQSSVRIARGEVSRHKVLEIADAEESDIERTFGVWDPGAL